MCSASSVAMKCSRTAPATASSRTSLAAISARDINDKRAAYSESFKIQKKIYPWPAVQASGARPAGQTVSTGRIIRQAVSSLSSRFTRDSLAIDYTVSSYDRDLRPNEVISFEFV